MLELYRPQNEVWAQLIGGFDSSGEKSKIYAYINWKTDKVVDFNSYNKKSKSFPTVILSRVQGDWNTHFTQMGLTAVTCFKNTSEERLAKCRILDESLILDEK